MNKPNTDSKLWTNTIHRKLIERRTPFTTDEIVFSVMIIKLTRVIRAREKGLLCKDVNERAQKLNVLYPKKHFLKRGTTNTHTRTAKQFSKYLFDFLS